MTESGMDKAFEEVSERVAEFTAHSAHYLSPAYQEAEVRNDFINQFFTALGWDVNHRFQKNPFEQEVKVENRTDTGGTFNRRVDYAFHIAPNFRDPRLLVEAKKTSSDLATADNYFQTIRYGWNRGTKIAALTNFASLHLLDCRSKPHIDTALQCWFRRYTLTDYLNRDTFAEIYWLISREAVVKDSLDKFVADLPRKKRGSKQHRLFPTGGIDETFLEDLDRYRKMLATAFKRKNADLDSETLTEMTQRTIDRLVFMRFLEDKLIEPSHFVEKFGTKRSVWQDFVAASHRLDGTYNGIVFKKHDILDVEAQPIDDEVFGEICEELSHKTTAYEFNSIPIHILGSVYERFLGNVIVATAKQADVKPKPEVRKAGGVYYTPDYIVRYIVEHTVGKAIAGKTPDQIKEMRFADIACGSGSFLMVVYDTLLLYHAKYYNKYPTTGGKDDCVIKDGVRYLTLGKKRDILLNNIYGVDIDQQAVEVTQLSLYLKLLEEETIASAVGYQRRIHAAILPSLNNNIVCGNSLIGRDIWDGHLFDDSEDRKVNPMDFEDSFQEVVGNRGGFDVIVGNPPYDVLEKDRRASSWPHTALRGYATMRPEYAAALGGKLNLFRFFIVRAMRLLRNRGRFGMIVPMAILADISCAKTRRQLVMSSSDITADCFPQKDNARRRVFLDAKLSTVIITCIKNPPKSEESAILRVRVFPWNRFEDEFRETTVRFADTAIIDPINRPIPLTNGTDWDLCLKVHSAQGVVRLGEVADFSITRGEINQSICRDHITSNKRMSRMLKGVEVGQYQLNETLQQGEQEWFNATSYNRDHTPRTVCQQRRIATQRITGVDERLRIVATIVEPPMYFADSTNSITVIAGSNYRLEFLLALLNSTLFQWRFKITSTNNNVGTNELEGMPFRTIDLSDATSNALHDAMVGFVEQLMDAKCHLTAAKSDRQKSFYAAKCVSLDRRINDMVYKLFGLNADEIRMVEKTKGRPKPMSDVALLEFGE